MRGLAGAFTFRAGKGLLRREGVLMLILVLQIPVLSNGRAAVSLLGSSDEAFSSRFL